MDTTLKCNKPSRRLLGAFPTPVASRRRVEVDASVAHHYLLASDKVKAEVLSRSQRRKSNLRPRRLSGYQRPLPRKQSYPAARSPCLPRRVCDFHSAMQVNLSTITLFDASITHPTPCLHSDRFSVRLFFFWSENSPKQPP